MWSSISGMRPWKSIYNFRFIFTENRERKKVAYLIYCRVVDVLASPKTGVRKEHNFIAVNDDGTHLRCSPMGQENVIAGNCEIGKKKERFLDQSRTIRG